MTLVFLPRPWAAPACSPPRAARDGGGDRTRTDDTLVANQVLYQLSYAPVGIQPARSSPCGPSHSVGSPCTRTAEVVGLSGLEPPTSRLSGERSNQLSYRPGGIAPPPTLSSAHRRTIRAAAALRARRHDGRKGWLSSRTWQASLCSLSAARSRASMLAHPGHLHAHRLTNPLERR